MYERLQRNYPGNVSLSPKYLFDYSTCIGFLFHQLHDLCMYNKHAQNRDFHWVVASIVSQILAYLTVLDFSEATAPLPLYSNRLGSPLRKSTRIQNQYAVGRSDLVGDLLDQLIPNGIVCPLAGANELLERATMHAMLGRDRFERSSV